MADSDPERADAGFSFIELLVIIIIIGVLATIVVGGARKVHEKGQLSACAADFQSLSTAVEVYFVEYDTTTIPDAGGAQGVEQTLVDANVVRSVSEYWDVAPDGTVTAVAPC